MDIQLNSSSIVDLRALSGVTGTLYVKRDGGTQEVRVGSAANLVGYSTLQSRAETSFAGAAYALGWGVLSVSDRPYSDGFVLPVPALPTYGMRKWSTPVGHACNATWNNTTGAFTLATAFQPVYSQGIWLRFTAVGQSTSTGGPAVGGIYWCVMSSTTVGQAYALRSDPAVGFCPYTPDISGALLSTVAGTHWAATGTDITLASISCPAGALGSQGTLRTEMYWSVTNSATSKIVKQNFGGNTLFNQPYTTVGGARVQTLMHNVQSKYQKYIAGNAGIAGVGGTTSGYLINGTEDTTLARDVLFIANTNGVDSAVLEFAAIEVLPA
jgi:hypothetical protein